MAKPLCIFSFIVSALVFLLFAVNIITNSPFGATGGLLMDIGMITGSGIIGTFSVLTYLESQ